MRPTGLGIFLYRWRRQRALALQPNADDEVGPVHNSPVFVPAEVAGQNPLAA